MFKLPPRRLRTPWGALFWALPMAFIFVDPYQRGAHWVEWLLTILAFVVFLALYVLGMVYFSERRIMVWVCTGVTALGVVFFAFRYSGLAFFTLVAAFAPFTVGGNIPRSVALICGVLSLMWFEWWLLMQFAASSDQLLRMLQVVSIESVLIGGGTTFVARQMPHNERDLRVDERERIARDLHDVLGHTLTSITLKAELAGRLFTEKPERALAEINDVERISRAALEEVRQAIHGYHAGDMTTEFERAEAMLRAAGVKPERHFTLTTIEPAQERVLALALREAVTNVVRHSQAKVCWLAFYKIDGAYRLEVKDDGRGGAIAEGLGARSIRTRVEALGGTVAWHGDSGMRVVIDIPLTAMHS